MTVATPMAPAYTVGSFLSEVHLAAVSATVLEEAEPPRRVNAAQRQRLLRRERHVHGATMASKR